MKPFLSYYGGKQRLSSVLVPLVEKIQHTVYCEPFFGGGAVFFAREQVQLSNNSFYREVINDHSHLLINLYRVARQDPERFNETIFLTPYSRAEHKRANEILDNCQDYSDWDKAWAYYVCINQSFSNDASGGWRTSVISTAAANKWDSKRKVITPCLERLRTTHIECRDALDVIRTWDSPQTCFYLDPPYPGAHQGHYKGYTHEDFQNLCDLIDGIQGSYVLSNYDVGIEPKSAMRHVKVHAHASSKKQTEGRDRVEHIWVCDRSGSINSELLRNFESSKKMQLSLL